MDRDRSSSPDSFSSVTSITCGFTPHARETIPITAAAVNPAPPGTAAQNSSAGCAATSTRRFFTQNAPAQLAPCAARNAWICSSVIDDEL